MTATAALRVYAARALMPRIGRCLPSIRPNLIRSLSSMSCLHPACVRSLTPQGGVSDL